MERILVIKDFFELVALTKSEKVRLIKELMSEWHLAESDIAVFPVSINKDLTKKANDVQNSPSDKLREETVSPVFEPPVAKRRGRKKKTETESVSQNAVSPDQILPENAFKKRRGRPPKNHTNSDEAFPTPEPPVAKQKGRKKKTETEKVSQNAVSPDQILPENAFKKRRGRPPKNHTNTDIAESVDQEFEDAPKVLSAEDEALIKATEAGVKQPGSSKAVKYRNQAFVYQEDVSELKELIIGQKYDFEFLYQWKNKELLSPYVLDGLMPVGIYIPYKNLVFGKYRGFIVSIYDEQVADNVADAKKMAQTMSSIDDEFWTIMDSLQWSVLKAYGETINRMLSKVGGDSIKSVYRTCSPRANTICGLGGFRYTINVK